ncbi:hypothetical protein ABEW60_00170 [Paenibacillus jamilae]|uniref:hypothetical protein n=1 Tax=Paenibacillus jamilae TaxID=114136 RepID=UPI003D294C40
MTVPILNGKHTTGLKKGRAYTMEIFLQGMFVQHDRPHKEQIINSLQAITKNIFH